MHNITLFTDDRNSVLHHSLSSQLPLSQLDVLKALESLDVSKAMGIDGIPPKLLRNCALALFQSTIYFPQP